MKRIVLPALILAAACSDALEQTSSAGQLIGVVNASDRTLSVISATDFSVRTRSWQIGSATPRTIDGHGPFFVVPLGSGNAVGLGKTETGAAVAVRSDLCKGPLSVRNRRPGDRFRPSGLGGQKKLQDFFVDRKIARQTRDAVPLVVDSGDRIVWVAGYSIDEAFRVTDPAQAVLILRLKQV